MLAFHIYVAVLLLLILCMKYSMLSKYYASYLFAPSPTVTYN